MTKLRLGTRGSDLARRQSELVAQALQKAQPDLEIDLRVVRTEGDRRHDVSLESVGGQGIFVKDIERLLIAGEIDIAVHSLKDMPAEAPAELTIGAVLPRADVRDALVSHGDRPLASLVGGARVGTDSRRRAAQILALRPDLAPTSVRGNVDSRVRKAESGEYEAVILAVAGLERLRLLDRASQIFTIEEMLPAAGQGVLAVEARRDDMVTLGFLARIDDGPTRAAITAERAYLARLGAGCRLPVAAYGTVSGDNVLLKVMLALDDGPILRDEDSAPINDAALLGASLAEKMLVAAGAAAPK